MMIRFVFVYWVRLLRHMETPRKRSGGAPETPKGRAMGSRVVCATPKGTRAVNNYSLGDRLGRGAFATVYKAIHLQTAEVAAIKQIPLNKIKSVDSIMGEIELLRDLEHPNIVKYFGFMKDEEHLNIVLEYCENGSLAMILHKFGSFPENLVARYMHQVLEGLAYLHRQGTIHRDIKGGNILTTKDGIAKLADFGVATRIEEESDKPSKSGVVGTPHWMAPEIIQQQAPTPACDIWSLGATVVELRTGQPPYGERPDMSAMFAIVQQDSTAMIPADSTGGLRDFLVLCFEKDPRLRVTATDLLKHPWITKFFNGHLALSPERAVQEWNSPSRRRRLAVPSMMNLKSAMKKPVKRRSEDFENDFDSLGKFGEPKRVTLAPVDQNALALLPVKDPKMASPLAPSPRKPLTDFIEQDSDYDDDFDSPRESEKNPKSTEADVICSDASEDPFNGLEDLLEDGPDETVLCAQDEACQIIAHIFSNELDLVIAFKRLSELILSKPLVRKTIDQMRLLPRVLALLEGRLNDSRSDRVYASFLELIDNCIPEPGADFITKFCIAGGLSFVLTHSTLSPSKALNLVYKMCTIGSSEIARQLAFREDAIAVVCGFFRSSASRQDLCWASAVILEMFNVCEPQLRANLWYHFNAYTLFHRLVLLLPAPIVLANDPKSAVSRNFYELVVSYSRTPQELLAETVDGKVLRKMMRAFIHLPPESPHRRIILEFFKTVSTLPSVLDAMQHAKVVPHLIAALRRSLHDPRIDDQACYVTMNLLVPTLFNYSRIDPDRQIEVAKYNLLPLLQDCVRRSPRLREFAFPIFSAIAHAESKACWNALLESNALMSFLDLITETGWQAMAISAIAVWMHAQPDIIGPELKPKLGVINQALLTTSGLTFESVLSATTSLLDTNPVLCYDIPLAGLFKALNSYLSISHRSSSSASMVQALHIIELVSSRKDFQHEFAASGLSETTITLQDEPGLPVMCSKLISRILRHVKYI